MTSIPTRVGRRGVYRPNRFLCVRPATTDFRVLQPTGTPDEPGQDREAVRPGGGAATGFARAEPKCLRAEVRSISNTGSDWRDGEGLDTE